MKALFINGGPRKNWTTFKMLDQAVRGASDAGAETEVIHLYDYDFKGCRSCFACKLKDAKTNCVCAINDDLRPVLEKAQEADVIVIGTPIYFSFPTGVTRAFMERLLFPVLSYSKGSLKGRTVPTAIIYTMGCPEEAAKVNYPELFRENSRGLEMLFGYSETLCSYTSFQFDDHSKYDVREGSLEARTEYLEKKFPGDLQKAYELGQRLVQKAKSASC